MALVTHASHMRSSSRLFTYGLIFLLVLTAFAAGNALGTNAAVKAFIDRYDSSSTAPAGYRCWNEIDASAPNGVSRRCGSITP
jgi:hypothetical protein